MAVLPTLHTLDYPAWAAFCPPAAPTDGLELKRNKAWAGLLCPKLLQRAPGKRHQPHQSTHRDPKTQQGQSQGLPRRRKALLSVLSHLWNHCSLLHSSFFQTPPSLLFATSSPACFPQSPLTVLEGPCPVTAQHPCHLQCFSALFCPSAPALPGCLQEDRQP